MDIITISDNTSPGIASVRHPSVLIRCTYQSNKKPETASSSTPEPESVSSDSSGRCPGNWKNDRKKFRGIKELMNETSPSANTKVKSWLRKCAVLDKTVVDSGVANVCPLRVEDISRSFITLPQQAKKNGSILIRHDYKKGSPYFHDVSYSSSQTYYSSRRTIDDSLLWTDSFKLNKAVSFNGTQDLRKSESTDHLQSLVDKEAKSISSSQLPRKIKQISSSVIEVPLSPESQKKNELCSYLQLMNMNSTNKTIGHTYKQRRSVRVKNLIILSEKKKLEQKLLSEAKKEDEKLGEDDVVQITKEDIDRVSCAASEQLASKSFAELKMNVMEKSDKVNNLNIFPKEDIETNIMGKDEYNNEKVSNPMLYVNTIPKEVLQSINDFDKVMENFIDEERITVKETFKKTALVKNVTKIPNRKIRKKGKQLSKINSRKKILTLSLRRPRYKSLRSNLNLAKVGLKSLVLKNTELKRIQKRKEALRQVKTSRKKQKIIRNRQGKRRELVVFLTRQSYEGRKHTLQHNQSVKSPFILKEKNCKTGSLTESVKGDDVGMKVGRSLRLNKSKSEELLYEKTSSPSVRSLEVATTVFPKRRERPLKHQIRNTHKKRKHSSHSNASKSLQAFREKSFCVIDLSHPKSPSSVGTLREHDYATKLEIDRSHVMNVIIGETPNIEKKHPSSDEVVDNECDSQVPGNGISAMKRNEIIEKSPRKKTKLVSSNKAVSDEYDPQLLGGKFTEDRILTMHATETTRVSPIMKEHVTCDEYDSQLPENKYVEDEFSAVKTKKLVEKKSLSDKKVVSDCGDNVMVSVDEYIKGGGVLTVETKKILEDIIGINPESSKETCSYILPHRTLYSESCGSGEDLENVERKEEPLLEQDLKSGTAESDMAEESQVSMINSVKLDRLPLSVLYTPLNATLATKSLCKNLIRSKRKLWPQMADLTSDCSEHTWDIDGPSQGRQRSEKKSYAIRISQTDGAVINAFYLDFNLIVAQERVISFWTQSALGNMLGAQNMWISKGTVQRLVTDGICIFKESSQMIISLENSVAYVELWVKEHKSEKRERPVADIFAIIYFWKHKCNGPNKKVLQLENINGYACDVQYVVLRNSQNIIVSWCETFDDVRKTFIHCYNLASDYQNVVNIKEMGSVDHYVASLHNIEDCDTLVMGCGEHKVTLWNVEYSYVVATVEINDIRSYPSTLWVKCDRGFLFTLQMYETERIFKLIAINGINQSWKKLQAFTFPYGFNGLRGVCIDNNILAAFYENGVICWNIQTGESVIEEMCSETVYIPYEKHVVMLTADGIFVRHALSHFIASYDF